MEPVGAISEIASPSATSISVALLSFLTGSISFQAETVRWRGGDRTQMDEVSDSHSEETHGREAIATQTICDWWNFRALIFGFQV